MQARMQARTHAPTHIGVICIGICWWSDRAQQTGQDQGQPDQVEQDFTSSAKDALPLPTLGRATMTACDQ